ncbi:MAG: alanine racemase [Muribaculaceae bacterium]|nr:alanine racemase [Muribaculaceae bacterium]
MEYSIHEIASTIGAKIMPHDAPDTRIALLLTDSRSLVDAPKTLFFALKGDGNDGHRYVEPLYRKGVRYFVVEDLPDVGTMPEATFLVVDNSLTALQTLAAAHRRRFDIPVLAITGSRGKTIVKEWLYQLLKDDYRIVRSPRSYNSQIGVPLSLWEMTPDTTLALIEAGISTTGEMARLQQMIAPTVGIVTNVLDDHDEGFASRDEKRREKMSLLEGCTVAIAPETDDRRAPDDQAAIDARNAHTCRRVLRALGYADDEIEHRLARLTPINTRLDVIAAVNECTLIVDGYTSDTSSLAAALDFMKRRTTQGQSNTVILSDLVDEATVSSHETYATVARLLAERNVTRLVGVGPELCRHRDCFANLDTCLYPSTAALLASFSQGDYVNETILLKGQPQFHFNQIVDLLEARAHQTVEEIDLAALASNFKFFKSKLKPATLTIAMVKASGYGTGSYEVAKTLQDCGADYLAVAVHDEGVQLRQAGIAMPIIVLNPSVVNYKAMFTHGLEPEIYSLEECRGLVREGERLGVTDFPVHIKLDTGMHRLGFTLEQLPALIALLHRQRVLKVASVFSHLSVADEPSQDDYTRSQFEYFDRCTDLLQAAFPHPIKRHLLNTSGIVRFPERQMDMVRIGIGLYGVKTLNDGSEDALRPVAALHSVIISIKEWPAGTTIGYGRRGKLTRRSRIATVTVGYADGLDRHFGNGNLEVWAGGKLCPTVGNVCMDAVMVDVTGAHCQVGDRVEIFGPHVPIERLAEVRGTIAYEILTSISPRVKRVYFRK